MRSESIISNLFWKFTERSGARLISFIVTIFLARLLLPSEFGLIAMVTVFVEIANVFVVSGFHKALIQKKDVDNLDYSSIFYLNLGFSLILYFIIYFIAPFIADFYGHEILVPIIRVIGLRVILSAINVVQRAYVAKNMIFKKFFYSTVSGVIISGIIGIGMAYLNFGVWALVAQQTINLAVNTLVLWFIIDWRPQLRFSFNRAITLFLFGWKILVAGLLNTFSMNLRYLLIGKIYSSSDLAYYERGLKFPKMIMANINTAMSDVMFPVASNEQDNPRRLKMLTRKSIRTSSYVIFPIMTALAVMAESLIRLILTDKWLPCVPFLRIGCYIHAVIIAQIAIQNAILAKGRSDIFLKMDIISKIIGTLLLLSVMKLGVMFIAFISVITGTINLLIKIYMSKHLIGYHYKEHLSDNIPLIGLSLIMGFFMYLVNLFDFPSLLKVGIQIPLGIIIYLSLSYFFKVDSFFFISGLLKNWKKTIQGNK